MIHHEGLSRADVVAAYQLSAEANVNHWLAEAEDRGVLVHDIDGSFAIQGEINERLGDQLAEEFLLDKALVVDVSKAVQDDIRAGDLHTILANRTGNSMRGDAQHASSFTANSCVLCAGGRTAVQVARKIGRKRLIVPGVRVDPLSGRMWTGYWQAAGPDLLQRPLDADDAAAALASAFPTSGTRFSQIGSPLYAETISQSKSIMRDHCPFLPAGKWNWDIPKRNKIAICGIGALHFKSGHRMMSFLEPYLKKHGKEQGITDRTDLDKMREENGLVKIKLPPRPDRSDAYLSRVAVDLLAAINFAAQNHLGVFADVANRLYPCVPLPGEITATKLPSLQSYLDLLERINVLNNRAVVAQWAHLREASTWITAGGSLKLPAIWTLAIARHLEQKSSIGQPSIMNLLTTDSATAQGLLNAIKAFTMAPAAVQKWYADLIRTLFSR